MQVFCCFAQSVASTRWMLQDEMHIQNTPCDNCLIGTMIFMQQLSCICNIVACISGSDEIAALADVVEGAPGSYLGSSLQGPLSRAYSGCRPIGSTGHHSRSYESPPHLSKRTGYS